MATLSKVDQLAATRVTQVRPAAVFSVREGYVGRRRGLHRHKTDTGDGHDLPHRRDQQILARDVRRCGLHYFVIGTKMIDWNVGLTENAFVLERDDTIWPTAKSEESTSGSRSQLYITLIQTRRHH
jgi:hypothetical protein